MPDGADGLVAVKVSSPEPITVTKVDLSGANLKPAPRRRPQLQAVVGLAERKGECHPRTGRPACPFHGKRIAGNRNRFDTRLMTRGQSRGAQGRQERDGNDGQDDESHVCDLMTSIVYGT